MAQFNKMSAALRIGGCEAMGIPIDTVGDVGEPTIAVDKSVK